MQFGLLRYQSWIPILHLQDDVIDIQERLQCSVVLVEQIINTGSTVWVPVHLVVVGNYKMERKGEVRERVKKETW